MATKIVLVGWCDRTLGTFWCWRLKKREPNTEGNVRKAIKEAKT